MADRFWVGNSGNINDTAHWSTSSGGSGGASVPTSSDNAIFDANSFSTTGQTVTVNASFDCLDMNWTGVTNTPTLAGSSAINIYSSLVFVSTMTFSYTGSIYFRSTSTGKTITTNSLNLSGMSSLYFQGVGGGWTLQDDLNMSGAQLSHAFGTLNTNGKSVTFANYDGNNANTRTLTLGASVLTMSSTWNTNTITGLTFNSGTSKIVMTGVTRSLLGGGLTFYDLESQATTLTISGNNTFNNIIPTAGKTIKLTSGTTQTLTGDLTADGTAGNLITLTSTVAGNPATISKSSGTVEVNYYSIKDITATGGATYTAYYSTDGGGNTGWTIYAGGLPVILEPPVATATAQTNNPALSFSFESPVMTATAQTNNPNLNVNFEISVAIATGQTNDPTLSFDILWMNTITDRTSNSYYNYTDANRVINNSKYLEDYIESNLGCIITLDPYTAQTINTLPYIDLINLLENNINAIKDTAGTPIGWQTLSATWEAYTKDNFMFTDANNLEIDLDLLKLMAENIVASLRYCGTYTCGTDFEL